jgi:VWFA-related protein
MRTEAKCRLVVAAWFLCGAIMGSAQTASDRLTIPQVRMNTPGRVEALVSVVDERGAPVRGMGAANFSLSLDGKAVPDFGVKPVQETDSGISVVLAMDVSGSMKGERIRAAQRAAAQFVANLSPSDYCSLLAFGNSATWRVEEFTRNKSQVQAEIERLEATDPRTVLNEAFFRAAQKGDKAPTTHVAVVVMTDGRDTGSSISLDQAAREAQWRNVPIYALGFGAEIDRHALSQITTLTGGRFFSGDRISDLTDFYSTLLRQLSSQYDLEFSTPGLAAGEHKLAVVLRYRGVDVTRERRFQLQGNAPQEARSRPAPPPPQSQPQSEPSTGWGILRLVLVLAAVGAVGVLVYRRMHRQPSASPRAERKCFYCGKPLAESEQMYCAACSGVDQKPSPVESVEAASTPPQPPAAPGAPSLELLFDPRRGERLSLPGDRAFTIGRRSDQDLVLEGDRHVSREHASIAKDRNGRFVLSNVSPNGTYVNSRRIEMPEVLQDGDKIGLGSEESKLVFVSPRTGS